MLLQRQRDPKAAKRFFGKLLEKQGFVPHEDLVSVRSTPEVKAQEPQDWRNGRTGSTLLSQVFTLSVLGDRQDRGEEKEKVHQEVKEQK